MGSVEGMRAGPRGGAGYLKTERSLRGRSGGLGLRGRSSRRTVLEGM